MSLYIIEFGLEFEVLFLLVEFATCYIKSYVLNNIMYSPIGNTGRYCYFKTSRQSCDDGKPQYSTMKFTSMCSGCNFATFTFTSKIQQFL